MEYVIKYKGQVLYPEFNSIIVSNSANYVHCLFDIPSDLSALECVATFYSNEHSYDVILSQNKCLFPTELLTDNNSVKITLSFYGDDGDFIIRSLAMNSPITIHASGKYGGDNPEEYTPELWEQVSAQISTEVARATNKENQLATSIASEKSDRQVADAQISATLNSKQDKITFGEDFVVDGSNVGFNGEKYATKEYVGGEVSALDDQITAETVQRVQSLSTKQDKLIPGTNIAIKNNVISAQKYDDTGLSNRVTELESNASETSVILDDITEQISQKQDTLVSGTNIKTINNQSILGDGNINIESGGSYTAGDGIDIEDGAISVDDAFLDEYFDTENLIWKSGTAVKSEIPIFKDATGKIKSSGKKLTDFQENMIAGSGVTISADGKTISVKNPIEVVTDLPENPDPNTMYLIVEA